MGYLLDLTRELNKRKSKTNTHDIVVKLCATTAKTFKIESDDADDVLESCLTFCKSSIDCGNFHQTAQIFMFIHNANVNDEWIMSASRIIFPDLYPIYCNVFRKFGHDNNNNNNNNGDDDDQFLQPYLTSIIRNNVNALHVLNAILIVVTDICDVDTQDSCIIMKRFVRASIIILFYSKSTSIHHSTSLTSNSYAMDQLIRQAGFVLSNILLSYQSLISPAETLLMKCLDKIFHIFDHSYHELSLQRSLVIILKLLYDHSVTRKKQQSTTTMTCQSIIRKMKQSSTWNEQTICAFSSSISSHEESINAIPDNINNQVMYHLFNIQKQQQQQDDDNDHHLYHRKCFNLPTCKVQIKRCDHHGQKQKRALFKLANVDWNFTSIVIHFEDGDTQYWPLFPLRNVKYRSRFKDFSLTFSSCIYTDKYITSNGGGGSEDNNNNNDNNEEIEIVVRFVDDMMTDEEKKGIIHQHLQYVMDKISRCIDDDIDNGNVDTEQIKGIHQRIGSQKASLSIVDATQKRKCSENIFANDDDDDDDNDDDDNDDDNIGHMTDNVNNSDNDNGHDNDDQDSSQSLEQFNGKVVTEEEENNDNQNEDEFEQEKAGLVKNSVGNEIDGWYEERAEDHNNKINEKDIKSGLNGNDNDNNNDNDVGVMIDDKNTFLMNDKRENDDDVDLNNEHEMSDDDIDENNIEEEKESEESYKPELNIDVNQVIERSTRKLRSKTGTRKLSYGDVDRTMTEAIDNEEEENDEKAEIKEKIEDFESDIEIESPGIDDDDDCDGDIENNLDDLNQVQGVEEEEEENESDNDIDMEEIIGRLKSEVDNGNVNGNVKENDKENENEEEETSTEAEGDDEIKEKSVFYEGEDDENMTENEEDESEGESKVEDGDMKKVYGKYKLIANQVADTLCALDTWREHDWKNLEEKCMKEKEDMIKKYVSKLCRLTSEEKLKVKKGIQMINNSSLEIMIKRIDLLKYLDKQMEQSEKQYEQDGKDIDLLQRKYDNTLKRMQSTFQNIDNQLAKDLEILHAKAEKLVHEEQCRCERLITHMQSLLALDGEN